MKENDKNADTEKYKKNNTVNPDNPDKQIIKKDNTSKANKTEEIDIGTVTATTTFML